ncbi:MAG: hypothetical protein QOF52_56 [Propionibacteriaceae bacterium]|jgi:hypothetical protein|nr:hypothetical protein [Propionibacteriaceae bacterium]MDX6320198.1 hypothetical protein [Propionibacteriaceae bacterium]
MARRRHTVVGVVQTLEIPQHQGAEPLSNVIAVITSATSFAIPWHLVDST